MAWSSRLFETRVWPMCRKSLGGGELMRMEGRPDTQLAKELDMRAGIDGWHLHSDGMRGIASRVQIGHDWRTFTIRMSRESGVATEYEKRQRSLADGRGWICPAVTIQAYAATEDGPVLSVGIARTADVIAYIAAGLHTLNRVADAIFAVCPWGAMRNAGYHVKIVTGEQAAPAPPPPAAPVPAVAPQPPRFVHPLSTGNDEMPF